MTMGDARVLGGAFWKTGDFSADGGVRILRGYESGGLGVWTRGPERIGAWRWGSHDRETGDVRRGEGYE